MAMSLMAMAIARRRGLEAVLRRSQATVAWALRRNASPVERDDDTDMGVIKPDIGVIKPHIGVIKPGIHPKEESMTSNLPEYVDWREEGAVTSVKDQEDTPYCWAFAAVGAIEGLHKIKTGRLIDLSVQEVIDGSASEGYIHSNVELAFRYMMKNKRISLEEDYPFRGTRGHSGDKSVPVTVTSYVRVPPYSEDLLKLAVSRQPVCVTIDASNTRLDFYTGQDGNEVFVEEGSLGEHYHSLLIVGYGTTPDGQKYWLAKNSWGAKWGIGGYIMLARDVDSPAGHLGLTTCAFYPVSRIKD